MVWYVVCKTIMSQVKVVRIYLNEKYAEEKKILNYLHDIAKVKGVTVLRGITGFGESGKVHTASLVDLSLNLPLIIEFFDKPEHVDSVIKELNTMIKPAHLIHWYAEVND